MLNITSRGKLGFTLVIAFMWTGCSCQNFSKNRPSKSTNEHLSTEFKLDHQLAKKDLEFFTALPHPFGSQRQLQIKKHLTQRISSMKSSVLIDIELQDFSAKVPTANLKAQTFGSKILGGTNIIAFPKKSKKDCILLIGSHYDTKLSHSFSFVGANDSASSSVLLLHLIEDIIGSKSLKNQKCDFAAIWFDGEEPQLKDWTTSEELHPEKIQDNTYGSRYFVDSLTECRDEKTKHCYSFNGKQKKIMGLILLDMIGDKNMKITEDVNSTPRLRQLLKRTLKQKNKLNLLGNKNSILDDHIPFLDAGIEAINIIDFENVSYWHTSHDSMDKISTQSIEIIGDISKSLAHKLNP